MRLRGSSSSSSPWTWLGVRREKGFVWRQNSARNNRTSNLTSISSPTFPYSLRQCSSSDSLSEKERFRCFPTLYSLQYSISPNQCQPSLSSVSSSLVSSHFQCRESSHASPLSPSAFFLTELLTSFCCQLCFASGEHRQRMADRVYILN